MSWKLESYKVKEGRGKTSKITNRFYITDGERSYYCDNEADMVLLTSKIGDLQREVDTVENFIGYVSDKIDRKKEDLAAMFDDR